MIAIALLQTSGLLKKETYILDKDSRIIAKIEIADYSRDTTLLYYNANSRYPAIIYRSQGQSDGIFRSSLDSARYDMNNNLVYMKSITMFMQTDTIVTENEYIYDDILLIKETKAYSGNGKDSTASTEYSYLEFGAQGNWVEMTSKKYGNGVIAEYARHTRDITYY